MAKRPYIVETPLAELASMKIDPVVIEYIRLARAERDEALVTGMPRYVAFASATSDAAELRNIAREGVAEPTPAAPTPPSPEPTSRAQRYGFASRTHYLGKIHV